MLTSILTEEERREYITEAYVRAGSPVIGQTLGDAGLTENRGLRVLEVLRNGRAIALDQSNFTLAAGDRLILSCRLKGIAHARQVKGIDLVTELNLGLEQIAAHEGSLVEAIVPPHSRLVGRTLRDTQFFHNYQLVVLALHQRGRNVRSDVESRILAPGDVLLMMGTDAAIDTVAAGGDLVFFDHAKVPAKSPWWKISLVTGVIGVAVAAAALDWVPIEVGAIAGAVIVCLTKILKTSEAYASIEWNILFLIYGMLAMGLAMEQSGAAAWLANAIVLGVESWLPESQRAWAMLAALYLVTTILTEILSNNAVAALLAPIALGIAAKLGVDPRPFLIAMTFAASAAFATPIGYQTNTYVYGIGGYRFSDFLRVGIPLNILCFIATLFIVPKVWPF